MVRLRFLRGQDEPPRESVWDYPRPPRVEESPRRARVILGEQVVADSTRTVRVLETSHPPAYYFPLADVRTEFFRPTERRTVCEFKGVAHYYTLEVGDVIAEEGAWSYPDPRPGYEAIAGRIAFYPAKMDACYLDGELVRGRPGDYYGGWITSDLKGPFEGRIGSSDW